MLERIVCLLIGYVLGNFQTAYFYGKLHGIDIRQYGSGNAGTTNTLRVLGRRAGLIVLVGDVCKCVLAVAAVRLLYGGHPEARYLLSLYGAAGAILGHNFPFWMGFHGGKGIAASAGLVFSYHPYLIPMGLLVFFSVFFSTHYVSLASLLTYAGFLIQLVVMGQAGLFPGLTQAQLWELYAVGAFLTGMAYYRHRENIRRLLSGTERKTYLTQKPDGK